MSLTLNIRNIDEIKREIAAYPGDIEKIINLEFKNFGQSVRNDAQYNLVQNKTNYEGGIRQSIQDEATDLQVKISVNSYYAPFVEFGTKSFAESYVSSLPTEWKELASQAKGKGGLGGFKDLVYKLTIWITKKGGPMYGLPLSAAYPLAVKIVRNGVRQQPFLFPAFEKNKIDLIRNLKTQLNAK